MEKNIRRMGFFVIMRIIKKNKGKIKMDEIFEMEGSCLIVHLPKELDHHVSDEIRKYSEKIMRNTFVRMMKFDFSRTGFMDSSGIGLIMGRYKALGMQKECIWAIHVNNHVEKLLRLAGLHRYIKISKTEEDGE